MPSLNTNSLCKLLFEYGIPESSRKPQIKMQDYCTLQGSLPTEPTISTIVTITLITQSLRSVSFLQRPCFLCPFALVLHPVIQSNLDSAICACTCVHTFMACLLAIERRNSFVVLLFKSQTQYACMCVCVCARERVRVYL